MIKACILGADSPLAGQLIRILIHHPDVEIVSAVSAALAGKPLTAHHRGLVGDTELCFTAAPDAADKCNVIFVAEGAVPAVDDPDVRIVDLTGQALGLPDFVPGVCELNRKALVRGATRAVAVPAAVQAAVIGLLPLSLAQSLDGKVTVSGVTDVELELIENMLRTVQPHLRANFMAVPGAEGVYTLQVENHLDSRQLHDIYNEIYCDHNFVFTVPEEPVPADVANTNKCLINLKTDPAAATLAIALVLDPRIKGSAGNAVHIMNLLFGLHERTGLGLLSLGR